MINKNTGDTQFLIKEAVKYGLLRNQLAYILATVWHETGGKMVPLVENLNYSAEGLRKTFPKYFTEAQAKSYARKPERIANRAYANRMGNGPEPSGDGWRYRGRSYVQITGHDNYKRFGFLANPEDVLIKENGSKILFDGMIKGSFTGKKINDYITLSKSDFTNARRIINGTDKAGLIAGYAREYDDYLRDIGYGVSESDTIVIERPVVADPGELEASPATSKTTLMSLFTMFAAPFAALGGLDWRVQLALLAVVVGFSVYAIKRRFDLAIAVKKLRQDIG